MAKEDFKVLIVDDSEMNRDTLSRRLKHEGCSTSMAANGQEALDLIKKQDFDLVLLDIMMPIMNGYQVLEAMKSDRTLRKIPVIMVSAVEDIDSVMKCTELGADDYLTKPFDPVLLKAAIARALKKTPTAPAPEAKKGKSTTLQGGKKQEDAPKAQPDLTLEEVVSQIVSTGQINRKGYMHLSKAIFNGLFSNQSLSKMEYSQINLVFNYLQAGRIKIID
jgi:CheY-like chemotaxis protein